MTHQFVRWMPALFAALALGCNFGSSSTAAGDGGVEAAGGAGLAASPSTEAFGTVAVGAKSAPATIVVASVGTAGSGPLASAIGGADAASFVIDSDACAGTSLAAGQTCSVKVHFAPQAPGSKQATLTVTDAAGTQAQVALSGEGAQSTPPGTLAVAPTKQDFGTLAVSGKSGAVSFTYSNGGAGATPPLAVSVTGPDAGDFQLTDPCSGKPLPAGGSCQVSVVFAPTAAGSKTATLTGTAQGLGSVTAALSGTAASGAAFVVTPSTYDFGSILQGSTTATQTFSVQNGGGVTSGTPAVAVTGANATDFSVAANHCTSALAAGATCTVDVVFKPSTTSAESAALGVTAQGTTSGTAALNGTGLAPAAIALSPSSQAFGTWAQGQSSPATTFTLTNGGGVATGALGVSLGGTNASQFKIDSDSCTGAQLAATTGTCAISVHFAPSAGTVGSVQATLDVTGNPGGTTAATLTGVALAPATLGISPTTEPFGTFAWDVPSPPQTFTVTNTGGVASGTLITSINGANAQDFATSSDTCSGQKLPPNGSCTVNANYSPSNHPLGALAASLNVGDGTVSATAQLSATAVKGAALGITPPTGFTGFGNVVLASTGTATFTVSNSGAVVSGQITMSLSGSGEYTLANDHCSGTTVLPGGSCTVDVLFKPTAAGPAPGQLQLAATPGGPATYGLTGSGVTPAALAITPPTGFTGFGSQQAGTAGISATYTVTNNGGVASGSLSAGLGSLNPSNDFAITADGCSGHTLAPAGACTITVQFTPPSGTAGTETGTLQASASPGGSPSVGLSGSAYTPAVLSLQPQAGFTGFGNVPLGSSATYQFTLSNSGTQASGTPSISTNNGEFTISGNTCTGPVTTPCTFNVTFKPVAPPGTSSVTITASASPGGTASYGPTSGTGTGAVLSLSPSSWNATYNSCGAASTSFIVTNTGNAATTTPISLSFSPGTAPFQTGSYTCTSALQPNTPCTIPVSLKCISSYGGAGSGNFVVAAGGAVSQSATLSVGAGIAVSPDPATFGGSQIPVNNSYTQAVTVTNYTTSSFVFNNLTVTGNYPSYYQPSTVCTNTTIGANGGSCNFSVTYTALGGTVGLTPGTLLVRSLGITGIIVTYADAQLNASEQ
jgi:hypothetical protein